MGENVNNTGSEIHNGSYVVPNDYLPVFCGELYQMIHAGISPSAGIPMLIQDEKDPLISKALNIMNQSMDRGDTLSIAMKESGAFPEYMLDMVSLAEQTGHLEDAFLSLQHYYDRQNRLRGDVQNALAVPVVLFIAVIAVLSLMITYVLPVFDRIFSQLGVSMGVLASSLMRAGSVIARGGVFSAVIFGVILIILLLIAFIPSLRAKFIAWFKFNFGGHGILGEAALSRFAYAMAMATGSGMRMDESLELAGKLCGGSREMDEKLKKCRSMTEKGEGIVDAMVDSGLFSGRDATLLKFAERTGALPDTLDALAVRKEEETLRDIDHTVSTIEPVIVLITSIICGLILFSVMLPLMGLLSSIG